jgi:hypothetical protein
LNNVEFYDAPDIKRLAEKLIERYYVYIGHADIDNIHFCEIDGVKPKSAPVCSMDGINKSWVRDLVITKSGDPKHYCFSVWSDDWKQLNDPQKEWQLFRCLYSIGQNNDGKLRRPDIEDYGFIVEFFVKNGISAKWETDDMLPSLLNSKNPLEIPLPQEYDF